MKSRKTKQNLLIVLMIVLVIGCDQISKILVRQSIPYNHEISIIDHFLTVIKVENTGAFLSLGNSLPKGVYNILMIILPLVVLAYALYYMFTKSDLTKITILGLGLIISGGLGNIIDRILFGSVTDFLFFDFYIFHTGIVNIADISVTAGFFILIFELLIQHRKNKAATSKV